MKTTKRLIALLLVCLLALSSASCQLFLPAEVKFNQFVESLPFSLLSSDSMDMNFVLADPEKAGFSLELLELPVATKEDYEESEAGISELLKMLRRIDRSRLSEEQQLTYDVIVDYFERSLLLMPYYYQNNNYLGAFWAFRRSCRCCWRNSTLSARMIWTATFIFWRRRRRPFCNTPESNASARKTAAA